jgi:hypothetical protein
MAAKHRRERPPTSHARLPSAAKLTSRAFVRWAVGVAAILLLVGLTVPTRSTGGPHAAAAPPAGAGDDSELTSGPDLPFDPLLAAVTCPNSLVKEGADADRFKVDQSVIATTMGWLTRQPVPPHYPPDHRVTTVEFHTYQITGRLTQYRQMVDGDLHLVIKSGSHQMVAEIPYSGCVPSTSLWKSRISSAWSAFTAVLPVVSRWATVSRPITLTGLGYMDRLHTVVGQAPNGVELHPVIAVAFG